MFPQWKALPSDRMKHSVRMLTDADLLYQGQRFVIFLKLYNMTHENLKL